MDIILLLITAALCTICVVMLVVLLFKRRTGDNNATDTAFEKKLDDLTVSTGNLSAKIDAMYARLPEEFRIMRQESSASQKEGRDEAAMALERVSAKIAELTNKNYEQQLKLSEILGEALGQIRRTQTEQSEKQTLSVTDAVSKLQQSNEKKLDEMRTVVEEKLTSTLGTRLDASFKTVSEQLENLYKSLGEMKELSSGVTDNVSALNRVLTNVKARGTWAEIQLENILDQTIPGMFVKNYHNPGSSDIVEFAIKIPSGDDKSTITYLPVDSKFPMEDYVRLTEAANSADASALALSRKALEDRISAEAKAVAKYIQLPYTTPFAILYLATEGLYAEIASSKSAISEKLRSQYNIMIAGPTTVTALLNSLAMGFRTVAINEKANEIRELLAATKSQYENFGALLDKAKKKVDEAGKTIEDAQHRSLLIQKKLRSVEALPANEADNLIYN